MAIDKGVKNKGKIERNGSQSKKKAIYWITVEVAMGKKIKKNKGNIMSKILGRKGEKSIDAG